MPEKYAGPDKVVFAYDIGTTSTGAAYVRFVPDCNLSETTFIVVNEWPGQEDIPGLHKVPTVVAYNPDGQAVHCGAEAIPEPPLQAPISLVRHFKIHRHPKRMQRQNNLTAPPLPHNVTLETVYTDFLRYIHQVTLDRFLATLPGHASGPEWEALQKTFEVILAVPNGWAEEERLFLRTAVVNAGILPREPGCAQTRVHFVPEAEASVHSVCHRHKSLLANGRVFAVLDLGGSTVDSTIYQVERLKPLRLKEVTASACVQAGGVYIDRAFENSIKARLEGSGYENYERIAQKFELKKHIFTDGNARNADEITRIELSVDPYATIEKYGIREGFLVLSREDMISYFEPSLKAILKSVSDLLDSLPEGCRCDTFLLVGGLSTNKYVQKALARRLRGMRGDEGLEFLIVQDMTSKAAVEGASRWWHQRCVTARCSRFTYGVCVYTKYNPNDPVHQERSHLTFEDEEGDQCVRDFFDILVRKGDLIKADVPHSTKSERVYDHKPQNDELENWTVELYRTDQADPGHWVKREDGKPVPDIEFAVKLVAANLKPPFRKERSKKGKYIWRVKYEVDIFFGNTSLDAAISWKDEKGQKQTGVVTSIPNSVRGT